MMKNLKTLLASVMLVLTLGASAALAQDGAAGVTADSDVAAGLDLHAVAELFKDSENLEKFEQVLNSPEGGVNNLDLNKDGQVDFIRVVEQVKGDTHLVILQVPLGEDEYQDVATIAAERESGEKYNIQVQGDTTIYGDNYYVVPAGSNFGAWAVARWLFRPNYRPYVSVYAYRALPAWWVGRRPLAVAAYRARTSVFVGRRNFVASRTLTVRSVNRVAYLPRASVLVVRRAPAPRVKTTILRPGPAPRPVVRTRTETTVRPNGATRTTTTTTRGGRRGRN
jgi:hypothetical protein